MTQLLQDGPLVSVITCTFNRKAVLGDALRCSTRQTYRNLQIIVINDGGEDVADIVGPFNDPRIALVQNPGNKGKAACLNQALGLAKGKYVAYLDDDDIHYPHHVAALVTALESQSECQVAYSDLYRTMTRATPDGRREVLGKHLDIIRDFDRYFMFNFNHVLHVSVMHRLDLIARTGPYNEQVKVLIDWDMTRRLAFFSDFLHVPQITGEYCIPEGKSDRISSRMRRNPEEFDGFMRTIRTTRPAKPWPKVKDLSIVFLPPRMGMATADTLGRIWKETFVPYQVYLPLPVDEATMLDLSEMPNVIPVTVGEDTPPAARLDACVARCEGDCVAIVPGATPVGQLWVEKSFYALVNSAAPNVGYNIAWPSDGEDPAVVLRKDELAAARRANAAATIHRSIQEAGIELKWPVAAELPFMFDDINRTAEAVEAEGGWDKAAEIYRQLPGRFANELWMKEKLLNALCKSGKHDSEAMELAAELNSQRPTVESLLLTAQLYRRNDRLDEAVRLLEQARQALEWKAGA